MLGTSASAADDPSWDETWMPPYVTEGVRIGDIGVDTTPAEQLLTFPSYLLSMRGTNESVSAVNSCSSAADAACATWFVQSARSTLLACTAENSTNCLLGVEATDASAAVLPMTNVSGMMQADPQALTGDPSVGLATGGMPTLLRIPAAAHSGGDLYLVKADLLAERTFPSSRFTLNKIEATIMPVRPVPMTSQFSRIHGASTNLEDYPGGPHMLSGTGGVSGCKDFYDGATCFVRQAFPQGFRFALRLRLQQSDIGWLHGRIRDPQVSVATAPGSGVELRIEAAPIRLPIIYGTISHTQATPALLEHYNAVPHSGFSSGGDRFGPLAQIGIVENHLDAGDRNFALAREWLNVLSDRSAAEPSMWFVQTMPGLSGSVGPCGQGITGPAGLVTTNAAMYLPGPPAFDASTGVLSYKVLAPHFTHSGAVFHGTYNLAMSAQVARCIYGFSAAPVRASVDVVAADGQTEVATTAVSESGGYLYMAASGFTFSTPTVRVKLTQEATATPTPPTTTGTARKPVTIACVKGKTVRKVTALAPRCPAGFRKR